jgi:hypothetical protein
MYCVIYLCIVLVFACVPSLECKLPKDRDLFCLFCVIFSVCCYIPKPKNSVWAWIFVELRMNLCIPGTTVKVLHKIGALWMFVELNWELRSAGELRVYQLYYSAQEHGFWSQKAETCILILSLEAVLPNYVNIAELLFLIGKIKIIIVWPW